MFVRILTALVGAGIITVALLLMMNQVANHLAMRDPVDYFQISDFIPDERPRYQRPEPPPAPQRLPDRPQIDFGAPRIDDPVHIPDADAPPIRPRERAARGGTTLVDPPALEEMRGPTGLEEAPD